ncbi:hypothetical protein P5673_001932 [Acropora cervicornis]|uniref:Reverse transcriptase RNase H-like domain-containing protein n=1 Tax=Acropora cervicornis TaxID=6130 RepID=A0AAD9R4Y6_ACRCE|nr:hypothetical protein P5673_001932 [Acropora cervicornis]
MHSKVQLACHGKFEWRKENTEAFDELKNMISSDKGQAYLDPEAKHELHVDGCPMGLATTLIRRRPGEQDELKVLVADFEVVTDHKSLEGALNKPTHTTSLRVQRIVNRMFHYDLRVKYRPGKENISDYLSRHPLGLHS